MSCSTTGMTVAMGVSASCRVASLVQLATLVASHVQTECVLVMVTNWKVSLEVKSVDVRVAATARGRTVV